jgi:hypothetical protein
MDDREAAFVVLSAAAAKGYIPLKSAPSEGREQLVRVRGQVSSEKPRLPGPGFHGYPLETPTKVLICSHADS